MKKTSIALCLFTVMVAQSVGSSATEKVELSVSLDGGYRTDELAWSIGNGDTKKLSKLSYDDIRIYEIAGHFSAKVSQGALSGVYTEADISWGTVDEGDATDKDWENPQDQSQLTNYSYSDVKGDDVQDYSLGLGYEFQISDTHFFIMPIVGYAQSKQNLDIGGGATTLASVFNDDGSYSHSEKVNDPLPGDSASYDAEWKGAWAGVRLQYSYGVNVFALRAQYHDYDYDGVGNWKLIDTLKHPKSFTHAADGDGYKLSANYAREFASSWDFIASLHYTNFESDSGKEKNFLTDGTVVAQTFNGAEWESYSLNIGVSYKF